MERAFNVHTLYTPVTKCELRFCISGAKLDAWGTAQRDDDTGSYHMEFPNVSAPTLLSLNKNLLSILSVERISKKAAEVAVGHTKRSNLV